MIEYIHEEFVPFFLRQPRQMLLCAHGESPKYISVYIEVKYDMVGYEIFKIRH